MGYTRSPATFFKTPTGMKKRAKRKSAHGWMCKQCGYCGTKSSRHCGKAMAKY